ncbi:hypothetical protein vseg_010654 [Gypsophila vaccaria]
MTSCDDDFSLLAPSHHHFSSDDAVFVNPYESSDFDQDPDPDPDSKRKERDDVSDAGTAAATTTTKKAKSAAEISPSANSGEYRKDREEWSDAAIERLLDAYTEKLTQLNRGNLRGRDWEEVAGMVSERCESQSKSVEQCKNKVDNLKKRFKLERHRVTSSAASAAAAVSHWPWFHRMEGIVSCSPSAKAVSDEDKLGAASSASGGGGGVRSHKRYTTGIPGTLGQISNVKSKTVPTTKWQRVVFKISGAALACNGPHNVDPKVVMLIAREVALAYRLGVQVAIIIGGRNFFCGDTWRNATGADRCVTYQVGMMATMMNSVLIQSALEKLGVQTRVQTAVSLAEMGEPYNRQRAIRHLEKGRVVIFGVGGGSGNPLFSTDTTAALRASEIQAQAVVKGANIDGICDCNSKSNDITFEHISFREAASRGPTSLDMMALTLCEENGIPVVVFNLHQPGNISRALCGEQIGTLIDRTGMVS